MVRNFLGSAQAGLLLVILCLAALLTLLAGTHVDRVTGETVNNFLNSYTLIQTATDAIDRLHSTAESHDRVLVVEVMGRHAGWIAAYAGMAGGADVTLGANGPNVAVLYTIVPWVGVIAAGRGR